jgi:hypothetical protein
MLSGDILISPKEEESAYSGLKIHLRLKPDFPAATNDQYYKIEFIEPEMEIRIKSPSQLGLLYGVVTLSDCIHKSGGLINLDIYEIEDWPEYQRRIFPAIIDPESVDDMMDFALRNKFETIALPSRTYTWNKVDESYLNLLQKIKIWKERYGGPGIMQRHNIYVGENIVISNPDHLKGLKNVIQTGISHGTESLMILADDTPPFKFGEGYILTDKNDKDMFPHMAAAHCHLLTELKNWMERNSYKCEIYYVPAFYTFEDAKYGDMFLYNDTPWEEAAFGPLKRDLNYIGQNLSDDIFIVWTGPNVRSRTITSQHLQQWTTLLDGRVPFLWDNTIYSQHPFTTTALFTAYKNNLPPDFADLTAGNGMFINGDANSEGMRVAAMTTNDFLWNPKRYNPETSLKRAMDKKYGSETAILLLEYKNIELSLRKKIGERALWFEADTLWKAIIETKLVTGKNPFYYHFNYSRLKALRMQLQHSVSLPSSEEEFYRKSRGLQEKRDILLERIEALNPEINYYLKDISVRIE